MFILAVCLLPYTLPLSSPGLPAAEPPYANSQFDDVDGVLLHYRLWQGEHSECSGNILLIHGLGGSTYSWELTAPELVRAGYRVVAADLPVFGYSSRQSGLDHSQGNRARLLWLLLEQISIRYFSGDDQADWILIGHSMGAGTVAAMAMLRPDQTGQLILVDGALTDQPATAGSLLLEFPPAQRWMALALEHVLINETNVRRLLTETHGEMPTAARLNAYLDPLQLSGTAAALVDFTRTARNEPSADLRQLERPVKAIWGANDTIIPLAQAEQLQQLLPSMKLRIIPEAGHLPMETHADEFNQLLLELLKQK